MVEESRENRYWIKSGIKVEHQFISGLILFVDKVVSETRKDERILKEGEKPLSDRTTVIGVQCHWIDKNWTYQSGILHTSELAKPMELNRTNGSH